MANSVLIVEDDRALAESIRAHLERNCWQTQTAHSAEEGLRKLEGLRPDIVLTDHVLPGKSGLALVKHALAQAPDLKIVMMTAEGSVQVAVEAMKAGACDFLTKPISLAELRLVMDRTLERPRPPRAAAAPVLREPNCSFEAIIGQSPPMLAMKAKARQVVEAERQVRDDDLPAIHINGETGTGKELLARALHFEGRRGRGPFVEINCASLPPNLLESEFFGHERGAFTDAKERKLGLVEAAEGGTLFLDEIGEIDLAIQAKLLKLLEEKTVRRVGSVREHKVNVRIISATNRDLTQLVREGRFRSDLYFRLRVVNLALPPLRDTGEDILRIARFYLQYHARRYGKDKLAFLPETERAMLEHDWPGNVRELRNLLEQTVLLTQSEAISPEQLALVPRALREAGAAGSMRNAGLPVEGGLARLSEMEQELVARTLEKTDWNVSKSAKILGLTRDMLRYRIEKYAFERPE